jgi:5'-deoxynucleotidase YfbR-like HD superfamily hydrolase
MSAETTWVRGDWMQTFTGRRFYPLTPASEDVDPVDIAHALSLLCRYGGHVDRFYSVAEHCILMSHAVAPEHALWALLHDATEAYVVDVPRPLKRNLLGYKDIEFGVMVAIAERFDLSTAHMPPEVKDADDRILLTERNALMAATHERWAQEDLGPLPVTIHAWSPPEAERRYARRLADLTGGAS